MTDVSSENRKVDEFLQTLDKLSQERLMDDQKRQWQLERDIEGLSNESPKRPSLSSRASSAGHDIKELVFNRTASARNKFQDKWKNREKSLEYASDEEFDEDGYQLPYRPRTNRRQSRRAANKDMEIELPRRNSSLTHISDDDMDLDFGLKKPVARKASSLKSWVSKESEESIESPRTPKGERPGFMKSMKGSFSDMRGSISEMNVKGSLSDMKGSFSELKKKKSFSEMKGTLKKKSSFTEMKGSFTDMERRIRRRGVSEEGRESDDSREIKETKEKKISKKEARRQARILNLEDRTNVWRADESEEEEEVPRWKAKARGQRQDNSWIAEEDEEDSEDSEVERPTRSVREYLHSRQMSEDSELEMPTRARNGRLNRVISEDSEVDFPTRGSRNGRLNRQISQDSSELEMPTRFSRSARQNQISEESEESDVELPTRTFRDTRKKQAVWTADDSDEDLMSKPPKPAKPAKPVKPVKAFKPEEKEEPKEAKKPWSKPEAPKPRAVSSTSSFNSATSAPKPKPAFKPEPKTFKPEPKAEKPEPKAEKPEKPPVKSAPPKPAKLSSKAYEEKDSQELKDRILKLSPTKASAPAKPAKLSTKEYEEKDSQELKDQLEKLANKKQPPAKPAKLSKTVSKDSEAEAIGALHSLKPAKPAALKTAPKPEALQKFTSMKAEKAAPKNFQAELSGILRSSTEPSLQKGPTNASSVSLTESKPPTTTLKKSWTEPTLSQISHITKTRSKGPKRRLPKSASLTNSLASEKSESESDPEPKSKPEPKPEPTVAEKPKGKVPPAKPAKKPPPIKAKKPDILAKPRTVSGELFI